MVIDSSALVALAMKESTAGVLFTILQASSAVSVGAPSLLETSMMLSGRLGEAGEDAAQSVALLVAALDIAVVSFGVEHWSVAWSAFLRYGKGRHPAALDFGDCLTYATAKLAGEPLLCVGGDFAQTDLELVPLPA